MRLAFVGDLALGDHPKAVGFGFRSRYANGIPPSARGRLLPPGPAPDLFFGNLEFPLGLDPATARSLAARQCRGLDQYVEFLASEGISVVNVANNHSAQHGHQSFWTTVERCRAAGITVVGIPGEATAPPTITIQDRRISLLGWSDRPRQYGTEIPPYNEFGEQAYDDIRAARNQADVVIASIHWGEEFVRVPAERERRIARSMIDAGASIVVGHHPHVLRDVESYRGGLIAYSLGNFVGDMVWNPETRLGACLVVDLDGASVQRLRLALSRIARDYLPTYLSDREGTRMARRVERRRARDARRVAARGYAWVARREHRRHVRATALMMLRNIHRYPRDVRLPMLWGPLRHRLARQRGRPASP